MFGFDDIFVSYLRLASSEKLIPKTVTEKIKHLLILTRKLCDEMLILRKDISSP